MRTMKNMPFHAGLTVKIYPSSLQKHLVAVNDGVTGDKRNIKNAKPFLDGNDVDSLAIDNAMRNYSSAWKNMKERHTGVPVFRKKSYEQSYQTNAHYH